MNQARDLRRRYFCDADRIKLNVVVDPDTGCWTWQRRIHRTGYGCFTVAGPTVNGTRKVTFWFAHRWSYLTFVGPIPESLELDHLCRNRACVNAEHLEPVTHAVNVQRGRRRGPGRRTPWRDLPSRCVRGHAWTAENTGRDGKGFRRCLACAREDNRAAYRARRLAVAR